MQTVVSHRGGQIDISDNSLETLANTVSGVCIVYKTDIPLLQSVGSNNYLVTFSDLSITKELPYIHGYGTYNTLFLDVKFIKLMLGYWKASYFIAPRGEYLFQSVSRRYTQYHEPEKKMITSKIIFQKTIYKDIKLGIRFESYYDLLNHNLDFSYGMHIIFNRNFFLKKI